MKRIAVLGSGVVGQVLADGFLKHGYQVMRGSREPQKLAEWQRGAGAHAHTGTFDEAAAYGELVVLALKGTAVESVVGGVAAQLAGKAVIDATNPIAELPPVHGVLPYFTGPNESLMERLQKKAPAAHLVKAFSSVGNGFFVNPDFGGATPTMFICGDDAGAKETVRGILSQFGWETADMGAVEAARAIEPLCQLWCIPGLTQNRWTHAFKLLQK